MTQEELEGSLFYNSCAVEMSHIAVSLLTGGNPLVLAGVRELIAMYLLIPYITETQLDAPDSSCNIPKLDLNYLFAKVRNKDGGLSEITLDRLRNALCHSFVASRGAGDLILDDRSSLDKKVHSKLTDKGFCNILNLEKTRDKLLALHRQVIKKQEEFNLNLKRQLKDKYE